MSKKSPAFFDDDEIYGISPMITNFVLNVRKLVDFEHGSRFDEFFPRRIGLDIGFFSTTTMLHFGMIRFSSNFLIAHQSAAQTIFLPYLLDIAIKKINSEAIEVCDYDPPLIAKSINSLEKFSRIRGGMIGLYSGKSLLISACLNFFLLDFNGYYSMIMGPRDFVEEVLGTTIEKSWNEVRLGSSIEPRMLDALRGTMAAYGY